MGKKKKVGKERIDKYYKLAKTAGYRARSAFKLIQIAQKFNIFKDAKILIDLCSAPGGWLQVAYKNMDRKNSTIIGVDLVPIRKIDDNVITITSDINSVECIKKIKDILGNDKADVILNDGAPNVGTTYSYDSYNQNVLVLNSIKIASQFLRKGGVFVTKVFRNDVYVSLICVMEKLFEEVKHIKPRSSREISAEIYLVAFNYLGIKVDKRLFDYRYVFSDEFKTDVQRLQVNEKKDKYGVGEEIQDEEAEEETIREQQLNKSKKKKGLSTILKENKKKKREGYEEGDDYRETDVINFINSEDYIDLLMKHNKFTFNSNYKESEDPLVNATYHCIHSKQATNEEIFQLCKDLKVLGKSDLFHLIKWRMKVKKSLKEYLEKQEKKEIDITTTTATTQTQSTDASSNVEERESKEDKIEEAEEEEEMCNSSDDNEENKNDIQEFAEYITKKEMKEKKKKEKRLKKMLARKGQKNKFPVEYENDVHFNTNTLKLLNEQSFEDHQKVLSNRNTEMEYERDSEEEAEENESNTSEDEWIDYGDKKLNSLQRLEYLVNLDYQQEKIKKDLKAQRTEEKNEKNKTRRKRAMEYKNEELMKIQKIMELKNEEYLMQKKLGDYLSDQESVSYQGEDMESDEHSENENSDEKKENEHIKMMVERILKLRREVKKKEKESEEAEKGTQIEESTYPSSDIFFNQKIFKNIFDQLESRPSEESSNRYKNKTKDSKEQIQEDDESDNDSIKEIDESKLPKIPLPEKLARKERKKKLKEKYANNEIKIKKATYSIVKTENVVEKPKKPEQQETSESLNEYFSNLAKDEDELAFIRYIGEKLIHKKSRMDLIDESFNKNSYLEDENTLPEWFVEEEKKYRRPIIPIDKKILNQYKSKINKITSMPIKKVIEAKIRNKKREIAKMKKLESQIGKIEKNEEDPFLQNKAINGLLKKAKTIKKREKAYVVCTRAGSHASSQAKGIKGRSKVKYVDKRLKKDKKAKRRIEKRKKGKSRINYSKSRKFKFRKKV